MFCLVEIRQNLVFAYTHVVLHFELLAVRRRLQHLSGLPVGQETASMQLSLSLYQHIRSHAIPFLRIAAFIVREITDLEVPSALLNKSNSTSTSGTFHILPCRRIYSIFVLPNSPNNYKHRSNQWQ